MPSARRGPLVLLALAGLIVGLLGSYAAFAEVAPYLNATEGQQRRLEDLIAGLPLPISESSRSGLLLECYDLARSTFGRAQPTPTRQSLLNACRNIADAISASSPTVGLAPTLAAAFSAELHDADRFNADLGRSFLVATGEQWLAEVRVQLVEQNFSLALPATIDAERQDLSVLVQSRRGIRSVARRYIEHPEFRARVAAIVETLPEQDQGRFIAEVRKAGEELGLLQ